MKKILMTIPYFLLWVLYFLLTMNARERYMMGKSRGYNCVGKKDISWFVPGSTYVYYYDRNRKPEREYSTWKEFWKQRGYYN